ncbi:MAG TPA: HAMP domain-containing protein, partial [Acetobacteraceae bacterium]|nr:HAMP domain-containing protein [Acetobacteraceae bacterium]
MRLTIKLKLGLAFAAVIALAAITAGLAISNLNSLNTTMAGVLHGPEQRALWEERLYRMLLAITQAERTMVQADSPQQAEIAAQTLVQQRQAFDTLVERLDAIASAEGRKRLNVLRQGYQHYTSLQDRMRELMQQGHADQARALSAGEGRQLVQTIQGQFTDLVQLNEQYVADAEAATMHQFETAHYTLISAVIIALLIAAGTGTWMSTSISRRLRSGIGLAHAVAEGDLGKTVAVIGHDEVGDLVNALNRMTANLRATAEVAEAIASGDLTVTAKRRSDADVLGVALERMLEKLRAVVSEAAAAADNVSSGSQELSA